MKNKEISILNKSVICWWSGGVTSAVACWLAIQLFGLENCRIVFIDTKNEHADTYRFLKDCEKWYGKEIEIISAIDRLGSYQSIADVWRKFKSLNVAHGAICSTELKRAQREKFQKENKTGFQIFGFDCDEPKRAIAMKLNYPNTNPIFPLLLFQYSKKDCIQILTDNSIEIPIAYKLGFHNNNCLETGCVQGGIGYWQKMEIDFPDKFERMAAEEHFLTDLKGKPVTMLKDQSKKAKESGNVLVFLKKHPDYPNLKCLADFKKQKVKPLMECNGYCGTNDLISKNKTAEELNFEE